ncbi:MAG: hypothetical protein Fur0039_07050 [Rhodocyclaceae bacterium]
MPGGAPDQESGGETSSPSQVYFFGISPSCVKALELRVSIFVSPADEALRTGASSAAAARSRTAGKLRIMVRAPDVDGR